MVIFAKIWFHLYEASTYRVSSYEEEIEILKQWLAGRLAFLDRNIDRFDSDWQPRIQPLVEKKMQFPFGNFPGEMPKKNTTRVGVGD